LILGTIGEEEGDNAGGVAACVRDWDRFLVQQRLGARKNWTEKEEKAQGVNLPQGH